MSLAKNITQFAKQVGNDIKSLRKVATTSDSGLMSADDKKTIDSLSSGTISSWSTENRPTSGAVRFGFNLDLMMPEYWNGEGWLLLEGSNLYYSSFGAAESGDEEASFTDFL